MPLSVASKASKENKVRMAMHPAAARLESRSPSVYEKKSRTQLR
jgi:hypothetical protein